MPLAATMLALACASPALAQKVTVVPDLTARQVLVQLGDPASFYPVGEAIALTSAVEIATAPFGTSSGGFVFKLDPATGLLARTTTTFGPSFTERAMTSGEGQVSVGATFNSTSYDELSGFSLSNLPLGVISATSAAASRTSTANLNITAKTLAMSATAGVSENLDVGVVVPLVSVKLAGTSSVIDGNGTLARLAETNTTYSGIGDLAAVAKYRFIKFKGPALPDPGGIALLVNMRLPTGDRDNLRGLGVWRTLVSGVVSGGKGRLRPHGSAGFEYWSKNVTGVSTSSEPLTVRHQIQYAGGVEIEAAPKVTLLVDYLGQHILGGGQVGLVTDTSPANAAGITSMESLVSLDRGVTKGLLIPGMKVNLKGKLLLSLNVIVTMKNNGLHSTVTPVAGINLTM